MPRSANILLLLGLALGAWYGRFFLPGQLHSARQEALAHVQQQSLTLREALQARQEKRALMLGKMRRLRPRIRARMFERRANDSELDALVEDFRALAIEKATMLEADKENLNPPLEQVNGTITIVAAVTGLVTIDLGQRSGLKTGHTLEVYRLTPMPQHLGVLRITEVRPAEATGKLAPRFADAQVGDEVTSDIFALSE